MILSAAMMLRQSLVLESEASAVEMAVKETIEAGARTRDLGGDTSTTGFGKAVVDHLRR
jgi:3-isopropylmalate dehydrogenase